MKVFTSMVALLAIAVWRVEGMNFEERKALEEELTEDQKPEGHIETMDDIDPNSKNYGSTIVVDYGKSLTGIYDAESQHCYLIGGVDRKLKSKDNRIVYAKAGDYPVKDNTIIPEAIRSKCEGKLVDWVERTNLADAPRANRGLITRKKTKCGWWSTCLITS